MGMSVPERRVIVVGGGAAGGGGGPSASHSTACSRTHTTAMLAIYTSGRSWARFASGTIRLPAYHAKGVTSTCVMHSCIPNSQLLVRSSPTSCTRRETPSARVKTAFCANTASSA